VGLLVAAGLLSAGALLGVAASVGFDRVWQKLIFPHWIWLPIAVAGEVVAYLGYTVAYRELARAERGAELDVPSVAALVSTGFGAFVQGGGFALGTLEYAVLAPATLAASAYLLATHHDGIDPSITWSWGDRRARRYGGRAARVAVQASLRARGLADARLRQLVCDRAAAPPSPPAAARARRGRRHR